MAEAVGLFAPVPRGARAERRRSCGAVVEKAVAAELAFYISSESRICCAYRMTPWEFPFVPLPRRLQASPFVPAMKRLHPVVLRNVDIFSAHWLSTVWTFCGVRAEAERRLKEAQRFLQLAPLEGKKIPEHLGHWISIPSRSSSISKRCPHDGQFIFKPITGNPSSMTSKRR